MGDENTALQQAFARAREQLLPPPELLPSEWAEANVRIPLGNAIPGPVRFANAPYQVEPLNCIADPSVHQITLMWGAQVGKTQVMNCALGYGISHDPVSQVMMQPSQGDLATWLETKFNPMVDANDSLRDRIAVARGREGVNNQRMKSYPGGYLMFSWAGSPKTARGRSAPKVFCDEVDGYETTPEGHPVNLLWQRAATFGDQRCLFLTSTPTIKNYSFIESSYQAGDMRRFYVPCPHCEEYITFDWRNVVWDKDPEGEHLPDTAVYVCEKCGGMLDDRQRLMAISVGKWVASKPFKGHASFHLNEMYSPFRRLKDIVRSFLEKKATNDLQTFVNVSLAETWETQGEKVDADNLQARREPMAALPAKVMLLTAGVDVQDNRFEVTVEGWMPDNESVRYRHEVLYGDPSSPQIWDALTSVLQTTYETEDGRTLAIRGTGIDSGGHYTNAVYSYCLKNAHNRVFALKGVGGEGKPPVGRPSRNNVAKCPLFPVGVDTIKLDLFHRMAVNTVGPGYIHLSDTLDDEYCYQLAAETIETRFVRGHPVRKFVKTRERNEALDCGVYSHAAYVILGVNVNALAGRISETASPDPAKEAPFSSLTPPRKRPARRTKKTWATDLG